MDSSYGSEERAKEEAWIEKYRAALNRPVLENPREIRLIRSFVDIYGRVVSNFERISHAVRIPRQKPRTAKGSTEGPVSGTDKAVLVQD
jgi:hypothetical protein